MSVASYFIFFQSVLFFVFIVLAVLNKDNKHVLRHVLWVNAFVYSCLIFYTVLFIDKQAITTSGVINILFYNLSYSLLTKLFLSFNALAGVCSAIVLRRIHHEKVFIYVMLVLTGQAIVNFLLLQTNIFVLVGSFELFVIPLLFMAILSKKKSFNLWYVLLCSFTFLGLVISASNHSVFAHHNVSLFCFLVLAIALRGPVLACCSFMDKDLEVVKIKQLFFDMYYIPSLVYVLISIMGQFQLNLVEYSDIFIILFILLSIIHVNFIRLSKTFAAKQIHLSFAFFSIVLVSIWCHQVITEKLGSSLVPALYLMMTIGISSYVLSLLDDPDYSFIKHMEYKKILFFLMKGNVSVLPPFGVFFAVLMIVSVVLRYNFYFGIGIVAVFISMPLVFNRDIASNSFLLKHRDRNKTFNLVESTFVVIVSLLAMLSVILINSSSTLK